MSQAADSAGIPFAGRELRPHPFAGDDGAPPPQLAGALDAIRAALAAPDDDALADSAAALVDAFRTNRVLIPLLAEAGDLGHLEGRVVEKTQELSVVTVEGPDGRSVGVMFSGVEQMSTWRGDARPVPVEAARVAAWALMESISSVVIDPGSGVPVVARRGMLWSMVDDGHYVAPWRDPEVVKVIEAADFVSATNPLVSVQVGSGWRVGGGSGPDLLVRVALVPGLPRDDIDQITKGLAAVWSSNPEPLALVDGIRLELISAHKS